MHTLHFYAVKYFPPREEDIYNCIESHLPAIFIPCELRCRIVHRYNVSEKIISFFDEKHGELHIDELNNFITFLKSVNNYTEQEDGFIDILESFLLALDKEILKGSNWLIEYRIEELLN